MATGNHDSQNFESALIYALNAIGRKDVKLKDEQERTIRYLYDGEDVFLWLPTGFGKSICYECLPFMFDYKLGRTTAPASRSTVLVVSPLVSLMSDQVSSLRGRGVSAAILSSYEVSDKSILASDKALQTPGMFSLLFTSPEAVIGATKWREKLVDFPLNERIVAVAVDEVHCVSKWYVLTLSSYILHVHVASHCNGIIETRELAGEQENPRSEIDIQFEGVEGLLYLTINFVELSTSLAILESH